MELANLNLSRMLKTELKAGVLNLVRKVQKSDQKGDSEVLHVMLEHRLEQVKLHVIPLDQPGSFRGLFLLIFQTMGFNPEHQEDYDPKQIELNEVERLEMELKNTREYLQTTIEELQTSNEEMQASNEELQSANEELQSTNEELETSTEELNSVNEELNSVNLELERKVQELSEANTDMQNLLDNADLGVIILDSQLKIRRYTKAATEIFNLIHTDIGRPFRHITSQTNYSTLTQDVGTVLKSRRVIERFAQAESGKWYKLEMKPYQETEELVNGVMITIMNISAQKELESKIVHINTNQQLYHFHSKLLHVILDEDLKVEIFNPALDRLLKEKAKGSHFLHAFGLEGAEFKRVNRGLRSLLKKSSGTVYSNHWSYSKKEIHFEFHLEKGMGSAGAKISGLGFQRTIDDKG